MAEAIGRGGQPPSSPLIQSSLPSSQPASRELETGLAAYLIAETLAEAHLVAGLDVVIDAANYVEPGRQIWRDLARRQNAILKVIVCLVSDPGLHGHRLASATAAWRWGSRHGNFDEQRAEWTDWAEPHIVLDATEGAEANIEIALAYLG